MSKTTVVIGRSLLRGRRGAARAAARRGARRARRGGPLRLGVLAEHGEVVGGAREEEQPLRLRGGREELAAPTRRGRGPPRRREGGRRAGRDRRRAGERPQRAARSRRSRRRRPPARATRREARDSRRPRGRARRSVATLVLSHAAAASTSRGKPFGSVRRRGEIGSADAGLLRRLAVGAQVEGERREAQRAELFGERLPLAPFAREVVDEEDARRLRVALDRTPRGRERDAVGRRDRDAVGVRRARHRRGLGRLLLFFFAASAAPLARSANAATAAIARRRAGPKAVTSA